MRRRNPNFFRSLRDRNPGSKNTERIAMKSRQIHIAVDALGMLRLLYTSTALKRQHEAHSLARAHLRGRAGNHWPASSTR
jgi:hypothetical protein